MKLKSLFITTLVLLPLISCTKKNLDTGVKTLRVPLSDDVKTLDPARAYDSISLSVMPLMNESLYQYNYHKRPFTLEPLLAESLPEISKNGLEYIIKIKKGVLFHSNEAFKGPRELKAQDFIYAWKRIGIPEVTSPGTWIFDGKVKGYNLFMKGLSKESDTVALKQSVEGFEVIDDYTLKIVLEKPFPQLVHILAMGFTAPVAQEVIEKHGHHHLITNAVGTGPYVLDQFIQGSKLILKKNMNYRKELYPQIPEGVKEPAMAKLEGKTLPLVDVVEFHIFKESQPAWLNFMAGKTDVSGIPKDNFSQVMTSSMGLTDDLKKKGISLHSYTPALMFWLEFNMKDPHVGGAKNKFLRTAVSHAIDFKVFNEKFLNHLGVHTSGVLTPGLEGFRNDTSKIPEFSIEKAKKLLADAGHPDGKGLPEIIYDVRGSGTSSRQMAEFFKVSLKKVGIKIKIVPNSFPGFLEKARNGEIQFSIGGWQGDYPDPQNFLFLLSKVSLPPGPNSAQYENEQYEKLFSEIEFMEPGERRVQLIHKAEDLVLADHPRAMSYYLKRLALYHKHVVGYRPNGLINNVYKYVDIQR